MISCRAKGVDKRQQSRDRNPGEVLKQGSGHYRV